MTILLDTHTFLWYIDGSVRLSQAARKLIEAEDSVRLVSLVSLWEIAIKSSMDKLSLAMSIPALVEHEIYGNGMVLQPITLEHLERLRSLPFHHRDPFDRLLIAQSLVEGVPILSEDSAFDAYGVVRL